MFLKCLAISSIIVRTSAWGSSSGTDYSIYGNALDREWLYNSRDVSIKLEGCLWSYWQDKDEEESGCLEESSEDGTTCWYMMSNCRRAQVVWSVYASDSSSSPNCNGKQFQRNGKSNLCNVVRCWTALFQIVSINYDLYYLH